MSSPELPVAVRLHQGGAPERAEPIYRAVLAANPADADAWHLLGVAALQQGRCAEAVEHFNKAIGLRPDAAAAYRHLGVACKRLGRWLQAEDSYRRAIALEPDSAEGHYNLGRLLHDLARRAEAVAAYRRAAELKPAHAEALTSLGQALREDGRPGEAEAALREALRAKPALAEAHTNLGNVLLDRGDKAGALASYAQAVVFNPGLAEAHHNLGCLLLDQGQAPEALGRLRESVRLRPDFPAAHASLGQAHKHLGQWAEAEAAFRRACDLNPRAAGSRAALAEACQRVGKLDDAAAALAEAVRLDPAQADWHRRLGDVLRQLGRPVEAGDSFRRALDLRPGCTATLVNFGMLHLDGGRPDEARACFEEAVRLNPGLAEAHNNLGTVLFQQGKVAEARARIEEALRLNPALAVAHSNLGRLLLNDGGDVGRARGCFEEALRHDPGLVSAHYNRGLLLSQVPRTLGEAAECFRRAAELDPRNAAVHEALAISLADEGQWAEGLEAFARADALAPSDARKFRALRTLPVIPQSVEEIREARRRLFDGVARLLGEDLGHINLLPLGVLDFYLAYHGHNDRAFRADLARLYLKVCPDLAYVAAHCRPGAPRSAAGRVKVGFVSTHLRDHTIGRLNAGLIRGLDRGRFEVTVVRRHRQDGDLAGRIDASADRVLVVPEPGSLESTREAVAALELDVLFYPDVGMEPWTYLLGFARLAPVQCVTWGHPMTTGLPAMDYFVSSERLELPGAEGHYTERLVRLPELAVVYDRPRPPAPARGRADFGLPADAHLYGCLQTLFKFHPEFDAVLAGVLRRDPAGLVLLIQGNHARWTELLLRRFGRTMPDVIDRVRVLPPQAHSDFLALTAACDVMLDPLHFGGGNTTYEALACGVPVVTLPSPFLRGRITAALYQQMGLTECVAADPSDYVEKAVRLGADAGYRAHVQERIRQASPVLFENPAGVRALEAFFLRAVAEARGGRGR